MPLFCSKMSPLLCPFSLYCHYYILIAYLTYPPNTDITYKCCHYILAFISEAALFSLIVIKIYCYNQKVSSQIIYSGEKIKE